MMLQSDMVHGHNQLTELALDVERVREDFPILRTVVRGRPLVYLDNAATTQKPLVVIERLRRYYESENANIHRGVHHLSMIATEAYENVREKVRAFINAREAREIVFVRGTTEAINLVARTFGAVRVGAGDEVLISAMEHHSNIVPWQMLCEEKGARLRVIPMTDRGELVFDAIPNLLSQRTKLVAITHISNALGTINPVAEIIRLAHDRGVPVLVDGAQAVAHMPVDVQALDCDFYAFSGHKIFGPTGIGVLYARAELLEAMPPYQGGGDMIASVTFEKTTYNEIPYKFEAGTPNIAGVIGLGAALDYVQSIGLEKIAAYEKHLLDYATERLSACEHVQIIGQAQDRAALVSFNLRGVHPHDVGTILDQFGVAVRTGHHCAQPVMDRFGVPATVRASFAFYNTTHEIDLLLDTLEKVREVFK
ncbi:MAG: SufS family cysteine desulfurase [Candidatus Sumerlaeaceae bacterium]|jgi:cysteine desulfurase/selenocysteine lyase